MSRKKPKRHKRHKFKLGDVVTFKHAGSWRKGQVTELTKETGGWATYTVTVSGNGRIYPCLGINGEKESGWILHE